MSVGGITTIKDVVLSLPETFELLANAKKISQYSWKSRNAQALTEEDVRRAISEKRRKLLSLPKDSTNYYLGAAFYLNGMNRAGSSCIAVAYT